MSLFDASSLIFLMPLWVNENTTQKNLLCDMTQCPFFVIDIFRVNFVWYIVLREMTKEVVAKYNSNLEPSD